MSKVLLVAPIYPPGRAVGYERVIKFEKYLPEFGFDTCVLTVGSYGGIPSDQAKRVYRAFEPRALYRLATPFLFRTTRDGVLDSWAEERSPQSKAVRGIAFDGIRAWVLNHLAIPDMRITWLPAAVPLGLRVIRKERVDVILSSSAPETAHLVAACLAAMTKTPWVADFRDGWMFEPLDPLVRLAKRRYRVERRLEHLVISKANAIVSVTQPITEYFSTTCAGSHSKCYTITNGYDPDDWNGVAPAPRDGTKLRLVHTGAFAVSRITQDPQPFLRAIKSLVQDMREKIEILLVGALSDQEKDWVKTLDLGDVVRVMGPVSKRESLALQLSADVLLLVIGSAKSVATSKLYEYLYARRPILAVSATDTAAAEIIRQTQSGYVVDAADEQAISSCLTRLFVSWQNNALYSPSGDIERYHRRRLAEQLAHLLEGVIGQSK